MRIKNPNGNLRADEEEYTPFDPNTITVNQYLFDTNQLLFEISAKMDNLMKSINYLVEKFEKKSTEDPNSKNGKSVRTIGLH